MEGRFSQPDLVGYGDPRYYSAVLVIASAALLVVIVSRTPNMWNPRRVAVVLLVAAAMFAAELFTLLRSLSRDALALQTSPRDVRAVTEAVGRDAGGGAHRVVFTDHTAAARYGALAGEPTSLMPQFVGGTFAAFVRDWDITHLYGPDDAIRAIDMAGMELTPLGVTGLYRVTPVRESPRVP